MNSKTTMITMLALLIMSVGFAQQKAEKIERFANKALEMYPQVPALGIAAVSGDEAVYVNGLGKADIEKNIKAGPNTPFYIASSTKSYVAILASILAEEGKIDLDKSLNTYKPFNSFKDNSLFENVTIRELLAHTSGLENNYLTGRNAYTGDYTSEVMINILENYTTAKEDGKAFQYDNLGYNILDILLQEELGAKWQDLLDEKLFQPLGMTKSTAYISKADSEGWNKAWPHLGYEEAKKSYLMKTDKTMHAAGGLLTSPKDAATWLQFNINNGKHDGKKIYKKDILTSTYKTISENEHEYSEVFEGMGYGLGWRTGNYQEEDVIYHFGGFSGFFSHISFLPEKKLGVAVFSNHSSIGSRVSNIVADYAYAVMMDNENRQKELENDLNSLQSKVKKIQQMVAKDLEKRSKRTWQMSLDFSDYQGKYFSEKLGSFEITPQDNSLKVVAGNLYAVATPFPHDDTIRVELVPGTGEVIQFKVEDGVVTKAFYSKEEFKKIK